MATAHEESQRLTRGLDAALEVVLSRDRVVILVAIALTVLLSWFYIAALTAQMHAQPSMGDMLAPQHAMWSAKDGLLVLAMWAVMMVGMMLPSSSRVILLYAYLGRRALPDETPFAATTWFTLGYFLAWLAFSVLATALEWALDSAALLTPMMESSSQILSGAIILAGGLYQVSPLKEACLARTQAPLGFIERQGGFRKDARGAVLLGLRHGAYYVGCCWALMGLMFIGGVMNVLWGALLTLYVLLESLDSRKILSRFAGAGLIASGAILLWHAFTN